MHPTTKAAATKTSGPTGTLETVPLLHPQGCRTYLIGDPVSKEALVLDPHLDLFHEVERRLTELGWKARYVVDSHTHADHPSASGALGEKLGAPRVAHRKANHHGVTHHPEDGDILHLGDAQVEVRHAPGHTPDHMVLLTEHAAFSGDSLFIDGVARTDFLGGDAGVLYDTIHAIFDDLGDDVVLYPGHDYAGRTESTMGAERANNPWLRMADRAKFVEQLSANPPKRPANMDALLHLNREGVDIPEAIPVGEAIEHVRAGGSNTVIDVRMGIEFDGEHVDGSRLIPLDQIKARVDEVRATPAPRLLMCRTDNRARMAQKTLEELGVSGLSVIEGGIEAYRAAGGETVVGKAAMSIERQVRIGAGVLSLIGLVLGLTVSPWFFALSIFVGMGQVFAGVTDWCGMGLLLGKMPWNQGSASEAVETVGGCAATAPDGGCAASLPDVGGCAATPPAE